MFGSREYAVTLLARLIAGRVGLVANALADDNAAQAFWLAENLEYDLRTFAAQRLDGLELYERGRSLYRVRGADEREA